MKRRKTVIWRPLLSANSHLNFLLGLCIEKKHIPPLVIAFNGIKSVAFLTIVPT